MDRCRRRQARSTKTCQRMQNLRTKSRFESRTVDAIPSTLNRISKTANYKLSREDKKRGALIVGRLCQTPVWRCRFAETLYNLFAGRREGNCVFSRDAEWNRPR